MPAPHTLHGWQVPLYQATGDGPVMLWGVPQRFLIWVGFPSLMLWFIKPQLLMVSAILYGVAFLGSCWEPYWYDMLLEYLGYKRHYEG